MVRDQPHYKSAALLRQPLKQLEWNHVHEPGCYLHIYSGLLMRVFPEELGPEHLAVAPSGSTLMVLLSRNPAASLQLLRAVAGLHGYPFPW